MLEGLLRTYRKRVDRKIEGDRERMERQESIICKKVLFLENTNT